MRKIFLILTGIVLTINFLFNACDSNDAEANKHSEPVAISDDSLIRRGSYLVSIMACNDCHTPKKMGPNGPEHDMDRMLSGHPSVMPLAKIDSKALESWVLFNHGETAIAGPWGVSFTANITSDETGIGNWTEENFFRAMRQGKYKGMENGRTLLPPMPWPAYAKASDDDLRAIFRYLKSTKPVRNVVPGPIPPDKIMASNAR